MSLSCTILLVFTISLYCHIFQYSSGHSQLLSSDSLNPATGGGSRSAGRSSLLFQCTCTCNSTETEAQTEAWQSSDGRNGRFPFSFICYYFSHHSIPISQKEEWDQKQTGWAKHSGILKVSTTIQRDANRFDLHQSVMFFCFFCNYRKCKQGLN